VTAGYRIPLSHVRARAVLSNTVPTIPYRSAGRPEVIYVIERLIDKAALEHGFDRVALRRRNLIPPSAFPYKNAQGITYDNGTYRAVMERAMELGDWKGFKRRRIEARKRKRLRGIGLCCYLETTGGYPRERADIKVAPNGRVDVVVGTLSSGQSHETTFAQCVAEWLGVSFDDVYVFENDTDIVKEGGGSHSARSMRFAGIVMGKATDAIIEKGKKIAAHMLETAEDDIVFVDGRYTVKGTDRSVGIFEVTAAAANGKGMPENLCGALEASCDETILQLGFPYGAHVCEVEIDRETGALELVRYTAVDDVGRAINPLIVGGQTHGGALRESAKRCGSCAPTIRRDNYCPVRSWITPYLAPIFCRRSPPISARCRHRQIVWASAALEKAALPARSAPSPMQWSTRSPNSASPRSTCQ
jgi:aerobic carbon-monoxide dehydrogenase large subunit